jgi:hypothetical protein
MGGGGGAKTFCSFQISTRRNISVQSLHPQAGMSPTIEMISNLRIFGRSCNGNVAIVPRVSPLGNLSSPPAMCKRNSAENFAYLCGKRRRNRHFAQQKLPNMPDALKPRGMPNPASSTPTYDGGCENACGAFCGPISGGLFQSS